MSGCRLLSFRVLSFSGDCGSGRARRYARTYVDGRGRELVHHRLLTMGSHSAAATAEPYESRFDHHLAFRLVAAA
jgi:hypothetical protein